MTNYSLSVICYILSYNIRSFGKKTGLISEHLNLAIFGKSVAKYKNYDILAFQRAIGGLVRTNGPGFMFL